MAIALDENGNFLTNASGLLKESANPEIQNAQAECRCNQGEWDVNILFGKNILIWNLTDSVNDRCNDLYRICIKYFAVQAVNYDNTTQRFNIQ